VLERLISFDASNEHSVVSFMGPGVIGPRLRAKGIPVETLDLGRGHIPGLGEIRRLWWIIRRSRPDVLQTWMYHPNVIAGLVGRAAGVPRVCWNIRRTDFTRNSVRRPTALVARLGGLLSHALPDAVVYCAQSAAERHVAAGYSEKRIAIIRNGIDTRKFSMSPASRTAIRGKLGLSSEACVIGSIARYHPDKDHRTLLGAVKQVAQSEPSLRCILAGPGVETDNSELSRLIEEVGLTSNVLLLGPRSDIPEIMNALDVHVTSSVTEGFPNALAEAMACGVICVSTDVGDAGHVLGPSGWLVPPGDPKALGCAIMRGLSIRGTMEWERLRRSGRERCENEFSVGRMVAEYQKLWLNIASA
jgi:glycosyltransferase involved in cell wall biosynthesis